MLWFPQKPTHTFMQEDTAGNRHYSEFEEGSTGPFRIWTEKAPPDILPWEPAPRRLPERDE
jgi:hypothetical protein